MRVRPRDPAWLLTLLAGGAALVIAMSLVGLRLLVPSEPAVIPTEAWPWHTDGVEVVPLTMQSPFQAGDVVVAMDGQPLEAWATAAFRLPWEPGGMAKGGLGDLVRFDVRRGGEIVRLEVPLSAIPSERLAGAPIGLLTFAGASVLISLVLIARRPRVTSIRAIFVAVTMNTASIVAWDLGLQPTSLAGSPFLAAFVAGTICNLVVWAAVVHVLAIYPVRSPLLADRRWIVPLIYAAPVVGFVVGLALARLAGGGTLAWIERSASVLAIVVAAMLAVGLAATVAAYRRTPEPRRRQVRPIAAAILLAAMATMSLVVLPLIAIGRPLVPRNLVALLALPVPITVLIAIVRHRLFQVDLLSRSRGRLIVAREEERRRLRRDLHDGLGPTLAAIGLKIDLARERLATDPGSVGPILDELREDVHDVVGEVRRIARELRPPALDSLGLAGAIRRQAEELGGPLSNGPVILVEVPDMLPVLPAAVEVAAYRIAAEGIANVVRHASADTCIVSLSVDGPDLTMTIEDDGLGIGAHEAGVGTTSMHERAAEVGGEVTIEPRLGRGTRLSATLPINLADAPTGEASR